jgi:hypothetical protein
MKKKEINGRKITENSGTFSLYSAFITEIYNTK